MSAGSKITSRVVTSGRTFVNAKLELLQGAQAVTVGSAVVRENDSFFYDPRPQRASFVTVLQPEVLSRLEPVSAVLRLTATGRSQWLCVPPPEVRELAVQVK